MKNVKELVREKYGEIASNQNGSCCESTCCGSSEGLEEEQIKTSEDYSQLKGYDPEADLGLGCGLPTEFARIKAGDTVVDLGSGAGNDCFVARAETGDDGQVIGVDFTPEMVDQARTNARRLGYDNVRFVYGDIEDIPLASNTADVVVSNCVFNLVPNKEQAFAETYRILKPGGHFSISDIVLDGALPQGLQEAAAMYVGCVAGALNKEGYLGNIRRAGFKNIKIQQERPIQLPESLLLKYLSPEEAKTFNRRQEIYSITVYGEK